jgi:DNA polymerase III delta prime subunit
MTEVLWCEKYRPKTIEECVLPDSLKKVFQKFVDDKFVPNLLLTGGPGVGKTTIARAMLNELGCDSILMNGSLNVDKDTLRNDITRYASSISMEGGRKYIILDEADYLSPSHVQPALRSFMEEFSNNCGFILTCNYKNKLIPPLHSRCSVIEFSIKGNEAVQILKQFHARACYILDQEGVPYERKIIAEVIKKFFPDWRRIINELQRYSASGAIDAGILSAVVDSDISELVSHLRKKDFASMRKWIATNPSLDTSSVLRRLYDSAVEYITPETIPALVLVLADYQYKSAFVVDQEINLAACMTQIMVDCEFIKKG